MKNKKFYMSVVACLIPFVFALVFYNQLPEVVPSHWNGAGEIDGYLDKNLFVFGMPWLMLAIHTLVIWSMNKDPKHRNIPHAIFNLMYFFIPALSFVVMSITLNAALDTNIDINIGVVLQFLIGIVFIVIGNVLPKCKQSYTVGIKTPWALDDEENWNKTHRFGGFLWTITGVLMFILAFFQFSMDTSIVMFALIIISALIPFVYSYLLYSKKQKIK